MNTQSYPLRPKILTNPAVKLCWQAHDSAIQFETRCQIARLLRGKYDSPECIRLAAQKVNQRLVHQAGARAFLQNIPPSSPGHLADYAQCILQAAIHGFIQPRHIHKHLLAIQIVLQAVAAEKRTPPPPPCFEGQVTTSCTNQ